MIDNNRLVGLWLTQKRGEQEEGTEEGEKRKRREGRQERERQRREERGARKRGGKREGKRRKKRDRQEQKRFVTTSQEHPVGTNTFVPVPFTALCCIY